MDNLLAPLRMTHADAALFARDNVCALCLGYLFLRDIEHDVYELECLECGKIMAHNYISKHIKDRIEQNNSAARIEMAMEDHKPRRSEADILKELGF